MGGGGEGISDKLDLAEVVVAVSNPYAYAAQKGIRKVGEETGETEVTGLVASAANPAKAGKTYLRDKPRAERKEAKRIKDEADAKQAEIKESISARKRQAESEKKASENLIQARKRQDKRRSGTGRSSTIIGGVGGEAGSNRKTLLGM